MNPKHVLILGGLERSVQANFIAKMIEDLFPFGNFSVKTLESVLFSGQPLNMKAEVDNAFAVIILDSKDLFSDTITGFSVKYAKRKSIFVHFGQETNSFAVWSWGFNKLFFEASSASDFKKQLKELLTKLFSSK